MTERDENGSGRIGFGLERGFERVPGDEGGGRGDGDGEEDGELDDNVNFLRVEKNPFERGGSDLFVVVVFETVAN